MNKKKVLFISHSAGRTGAPLMLLNFLKWMKNHSDISFEILLKTSGELEQDFADLVPTKVFAQSSPNNLISRVRNKLDLKGARSHKSRQLLEYYKRAGISLIYSNTITNGEILAALSSLGIPVITHIHELDYWIKQFGEKNLRQVRRDTSHYIAASEAVKANLVGKHAVPAEKIEVVHSFIPTHGIKADPAGIRQQLDIPEDAFVILGSGHETWRKGKDLFVELAAEVFKALPERQIHFLWVGGWEKEKDRRNIQDDQQRLGLTGRVHFIGEVINPLDYFAAGDVFAMVSREDPFPLVCLEAALLGKPILCFSDSGGMPEFVEDDAGFIVPYLDLTAMSERIANLASDKALCIQLGKRAAEKVKALYDISVGADKIKMIIEDCLNSQG